MCTSRDQDHLNNVISHPHSSSGASNAREGRKKKSRRPPVTLWFARPPAANHRLLPPPPPPPARQQRLHTSQRIRTRWFLTMNIKNVKKENQTCGRWQCGGDRCRDVDGAGCGFDPLLASHSSSGRRRLCHF